MNDLQAFLPQRRTKLPGQGGYGIERAEPLRVESVKKLARPIFGLTMFLCNLAKLLIIKA